MPFRLLSWWCSTDHHGICQLLEKKNVVTAPGINSLNCEPLALINFTCPPHPFTLLQFSNTVCQQPPNKPSLSLCITQYPWCLDNTVPVQLEPGSGPPISVTFAVKPHTRFYWVPRAGLDLRRSVRAATILPKLFLIANGVILDI